jgi:hypothetical protein
MKPKENPTTVERIDLNGLLLPERDALTDLEVGAMYLEAMNLVDEVVAQNIEAVLTIMLEANPDLRDILLEYRFGGENVPRPVLQPEILNQHFDRLVGLLFSIDPRAERLYQQEELTRSTDT